ncbi:hypothetical protein [Pantoea endophytica]|uniref:hypothetical protein n=1 Tax=Pantoea endophytica TaxID=92488 RepID=UPI00289770B9|nr:hypothetical protein [Pantoea endophytica]
MARSIILIIVLLSLSWYAYSATVLGYYNIATEVIIPFLNETIFYDYPLSPTPINSNEIASFAPSLIKSFTAQISLIAYYLFNLIFVVVIPARIIMSIYDFVEAKIRAFVIEKKSL